MSRLAVSMLALLLAACSSKPDPAPDAKITTATAAEADRFVEEVNTYRRDNAARFAAAYWIAQTYISEDAQLLAAKATEEQLAYESLKADVA